MLKYKTIRVYQNRRKTRTIENDLTLEQARNHCANPETSSKTAQNSCKGKPSTIERWHKKKKHWFDSYIIQSPTHLNVKSLYTKTNPKKINPQ